MEHRGATGRKAATAENSVLASASSQRGVWGTRSFSHARWSAKAESRRCNTSLTAAFKGCMIVPWLATAARVSVPALRISSRDTNPSISEATVFDVIHAELAVDHRRSL
jgi:hypothetical protein